MTTIADRIAGRDLDREAIADELDRALELLALSTLPCSGLRGAFEDVELVMAPTFALGETTTKHGLMSAVASVFHRRSPMLGESWVGIPLSAAAGEEPTLLLHKCSAQTPGGLARLLRIPKSKVPPRVFSVTTQIGASNGLPRTATRLHFAIVDSELWRIASPGCRDEHRAHTRADGAFSWVLAGGLTDGRFQTASTDSADDVAAGETIEAGALVGARSMMFRRFGWGVTMGHPGMTGAFVECSPEGARALFADRNVVGGKRRPALRHWVKEHCRRGHTADEAHKVREHLRGVERFTWHGLDVKLQVPTAELEAAGLLAREER